LKIDFLI